MGDDARQLNLPPRARPAPRSFIAVIFRRLDSALPVLIGMVMALIGYHCSHEQFAPSELLSLVSLVSVR
jgi:hypothetical protein